MAEREYRRLTRSSGRQTSMLRFVIPNGERSSLWLGDDHLLIVDSDRFHESYRRLYFRDIQMISVKSTNRRLYLNIALGSALALAWLITFISLDGDPSIAVFFGLWFAFFGIPLIVNNVRGQTCLTYLRTAVQLVEIPPLKRVPRTHKILTRLRPLILAAQEELPPDEVSLRVREMIQSTPRRTGPTGPLNLIR